MEVRLSWIESLYILVDATMMTRKGEIPMGATIHIQPSGPLLMVTRNVRGILTSIGRCPGFMVSESGYVYTISICLGDNRRVITRVPWDRSAWITELFAVKKLSRGSVPITSSIYYVDVSGVVRRGTVIGETRCRCLGAAISGIALSFIDNPPVLGSPIITTRGHVVGVVVGVDENVAASVYPWDLVGEVPWGYDEVSVFEVDASGLVILRCGNRTTMDVVNGVTAISCPSKMEVSGSVLSMVKPDTTSRFFVTIS